ncbi:MAG: rhodanese-like domain-containing protein [Bacteroidales bacterium]|nr:rhodanese-like domain-containing protein [Bacteroidales bacterium]MDT8433041.1 rhodanese-like domain-containing protein [Bacteroidales bacterium]
MRRFRNLMLGMFAISVLLVSCGKTVDESLVLAEYMESTESPIDVTSINKLISAEALQQMVVAGNPYIIDIRGDEYNTIGHIEGAVQVAPASVIAHLDGMDVTTYDKIVIVCYTGQTAAYVVSLANMAGYETVSLAFGMSSWNAATAGPWNSNAVNTYATELEASANPKGEEGAMPVLETGFETGEDILDARIAEVNTAGFGAGKISAADVWANPDNYYIVNYWPEENYNLGHIPGAIQYTPNESMLTTADLKTLPADKTIVVYCYTGQGSAFLTPYLRVLGYDAKSLLFGINGMATDWAAEKGLTSWGAGKIADYPLVTD